jgi:two-component system, NarL family, sensor histidine kinase DesK
VKRLILSSVMTRKPAQCADDTGSPISAVRRMSGSGWRRWVFPAIWLVYLGQTVAGVHDHADGAGAVIGYVIVGAFAAGYIVAIGTQWREQGKSQFWQLYVGLIALTVIETFFAHGDALVFCVYLSVLTVAGVGRFAPHVILAMVPVAMFAPRLIWGGEIDYAIGLTIVLVALAMYGFFSIIQSNIELDAARAEVARLAAENERSRIARDLHDLLGHSLTTITVKAGLARRLAERGEAERAAAEISEVEELTRRTLSEVRAAVSGYRDVTLLGELASAREVLRASGIQATVPGAVDIVDGEAAALFGWVVREAVTNVVRHARANQCTISVGERWIEIVDDGRGGVAGAGNGLTGLRERLADAGGTVVAGGTPNGWRVRAELAAVPAASIDTRTDPAPISQ